MSFLDRVGNKVDNMKSKQSENSDVNGFKKEIQKEKDSIDVNITVIGEYYWNKYAKGEIDVPDDILPVFEEIVASINHKDELEEKIRARMAEGEEERKQNDIATQEKEARKAEEARIRKEEREEAKRIAREEKAADELTKEKE